MQPSDIISSEIADKDKSRISAAFKGKRVIISGAAGSIGSEISRWLFRFETEAILLLDISESGLFDLASELAFQKGSAYSKVKLVLADIRNSEELSAKLSDFRPDYVIHAAAYKHVPLMEKDPISAVSANLLGTANLAELSCELGADRFLFISTDKANNPSSTMGATKLAAERYLQNTFFKKQATQFLSLRLGNIMASSGSVYQVFKRQIDHGGPISVTDPKASRYFLSREDAVNLILRTILFAEDRGRFTIKFGRRININQLALDLIESSGKEGIEIQYTGLRPGERLHENLTVDSQRYEKTNIEEVLRIVDEFDDESIDRSFLDHLKVNLYRENLMEDLSRLIPELKSISV